MGGLQPILAQDCVELSIEFPNEASADYGGMVNGFIELINCGDEPGEVWLEVEVEILNTTISLGIVPLNIGAGEGISRELFLPTPPSIFGDSIVICVKAYADLHGPDAALASECATLYIPDFGGGETGGTTSFGLSMTTEGECVEVDLELPDTVQAGPAEFLEGAFELTNCGDEVSIITLEASFEFFEESITIGGIPVELGAAETIAREFRFPIPPAMSEGEYIVCVTATSNGVVATSCQTIYVQGFSPSGGSANPLQGDLRSVELPFKKGKSKLVNYPNPFNPTTTISFDMEKAGSYEVIIYNVAGQEVANYSGSAVGSGEVNIVWDAGGFSSGIYFYRLSTADMIETKKMMLLK
ncbi:MAG: T9SS type A sorting domain-containing protein [Candidatus Hodarchaeales archaeon]